MSYLTLSKSLPMNKVVISFWFRIPSEAAAVVRAKAANVFWDYRVFLGVIPLITWGKQQTTPVTVVENYDSGAADFESGDIIILQRTVGHTAPLQPSCIGVRVGSEAAPWNPPVLDVHIQTNGHASGSDLAHIATEFTGDFVGINVGTGGVTEGYPLYAHVEYNSVDVSYMITETPEYLGNSDSNSSGSGAGHPEVTLDEWHHLLISWEMLSHSNRSGASKMWCAIDDVNQAGNDLPAMNESSAGMGPNDHMSGTIFRYQTNADVSVSVEFGGGSVPSDPFQLPGPPSAQYATNAAGGGGTLKPIEQVELAELQVFTGVALNVSNEGSRRAFIDYVRDDKGEPVVDKNGQTTLLPVDPKKAEESMGKKPEILLHGTNNWKKGKNTGSLGVDKDGEQIVSGQFKPTGPIERYKPDPASRGMKPG